MMQNICKKFLLLLMFSLLRVDMLSSDFTKEEFHKNDEKKKSNNENFNPDIINQEENSNSSSDDENKYNENFENDHLNPDKTSSNIPFGNDNEYANDPEKKVINFFKKKVKLEEIKKNNKKKLEVLDILKNVNDHFEEKNKDKEEAIIKNQLTSIDIGQTFEKKIINKNDDVNTIHEVNSILNKRIEKNQELKTLRDEQRGKDLNGAINSYYELRQAESEIENLENEIKKDKKKKKEEIEIVKERKKLEEEIDEGIKLEEKIQQLKEEEKRYKKLEEDYIEASKKVLNTEEFLKKKLEDLVWDKSKWDADQEIIKNADTEVCQIEKKLNDIQQRKKRKEEIQLDRKKRQESLEEKEKKLNDLNLGEKMKKIKELEEKTINIKSQYKLPKEKEISEMERNTKELRNKKVKKTKKKETLNNLEQQHNLLEKEIATISKKPINSNEETFLSEYNNKVKILKEKRIGLRAIEGKIEEAKTEEILVGELKKREKERETELANLNMKKEKVNNGLKEVEERIMTLSPYSGELDLAIENIKKREETEENKNGAALEEQIFKNLKKKVKEEQKNYKNERVFQKFEDNMKVLDKYLKSNTGIERYDEEIIKVNIKDQNKISKTQNKESKDQNKISEEKTNGFGKYIASSTKNMKRMVEENNIINETGKDAIISYIDTIERFCENIDETQNKDPKFKEKKKEEFILLCGEIEEYWEEYNIKGNYNNKKKYNNKRKCTKPKENIEEEEEEGRVLKGQQHRKDKFLAKLHRFENFVENYAFGTTPIEQLEAIAEEKEEKKIEEEGKDILNKKEKEKKLKDLIDNIKNEKKIENNKTEEKQEEIINTKEDNDKEIKIENNNNEELKVTDDGNGKSKIENNNIEKEVINNQKRSTEEIISKGNLFDDTERKILLNGKNWHFDKNGKIVRGEYEEEINNNEQNDSDKNDDKSLINLIESQEYKDMKNRALGKEEKEEQKDGGKVNAINLKIDNRKSIDKNIIKKDVVKKQQHNAEYILKEGLQLDMIAKMEKGRKFSEEMSCCYEKCLKKYYPNLFKKNSNYIKTVNNVVENEKEGYEKFINTYRGEISKISPLILLRGFGRFAISFLFSTINSIMQFERKDVIGPYFSFYTLSFGRIVQPSFLRENIYIDISLSLLSLLIFSAVDSKIDGYYLSHYKITSPLCRFLSLIKYTTNAFNININFFVNKDFYMSFNIMSIFDSILSWYWFNKSKFEEKIKKEIEEYNTQRKSIKEERKVKRDILVAMLNKQKEAWEKHHVKDFFRRIVAKNLFEGRKNIKEENKEENNIDNKIEEEINTKDDKSIDKSIDDNINQL